MSYMANIWKCTECGEHGSVEDPYGGCGCDAPIEIYAYTHTETSDGEFISGQRPYTDAEVAEAKRLNRLVERAQADE